MTDEVLVMKVVLLLQDIAKLAPHYNQLLSIAANDKHSAFNHNGDIDPELAELAAHQRVQQVKAFAGLMLFMMQQNQEGMQAIGLIRRDKIVSKAMQDLGIEDDKGQMSESVQ